LTLGFLAKKINLKLIKTLILIKNANLGTLGLFSENSGKHEIAPVRGTSPSFAIPNSN
jgi:hypothetical protein